MNTPLSPCSLAALAFFGMVGAAVAGPKPPDPPPLVMPKPPPAQVSSSEGMPPLPYPVVPQKRQEKKNPPQPPTLLTKIKSDDIEDWARTPNDLKGLLEWLCLLYTSDAADERSSVDLGGR